MSAEALATTMKSLKLFGMAQAVSELATQQSPAFRQAMPILSDLIKAEVAEREVRSINYQMKSARFPAYRDLAGFRFQDSRVDAALVKTLHACQFIRLRTPCSSAAQAPGKPIWQPPLASKRSDTIDTGYAVSRPSS